MLQPDRNTTFQSGYDARIEADASGFGKCTYIIVYRKKTVKETKMDATGVPIESERTTIVASKSTETSYIFEEVDTGLSQYPVAWMNWVQQKNCYHGATFARA